MAAAVYSLSPGFYDTQYADRTHPDCRGRLHTAKDGSFGYRAVVPPAYAIPCDVSVPFGVSDPLRILIVD
jgi:protocatechuate 3,4-dioxygenase beta subunit